MLLSIIQSIYRRILSESFRVSVDKVDSRSNKLLFFLLYHFTDPSLFYMRKRLASLKHKYAGQRCFIMGNGPSLNKMDLDIFRNEYVWGSNRCYLLFDLIKWRPKFYIAVDTRVVPDNSDEINDLTKELKETTFFFPSDYRYGRILHSNHNVYWYYQKPITNYEIPHLMFSTNVVDYVYSVHTVTIAALQFAVFLGFNPIYLIGCDTNYSIPDSIKFENGDSGLLISTDIDCNHFSQDYFGKGKKWHDPHVDRMIYHYQQSKIVCDEDGIKVFNATVGGNLEIFPRINYKDIF